MILISSIPRPMLKISEITFTSSDIVKLVGFLLTIGLMWADLKSSYVAVKKDMEFLQYQLNELKNESPKLTAVLPKNIEIQGE